MSQDIQKQIESAIDQSGKWAETGWKTTFGMRQTEVNSLKDAMALPDSFSFKLEAVAYWDKVKSTGEEAADWGKKALDALKTSDEKGLADAVYFAHYIEKFYEQHSNTWKPVLNAVNQLSASKA